MKREVTLLEGSVQLLDATDFVLKEVAFDRQILPRKKRNAFLQLVWPSVEEIDYNAAPTELPSFRVSGIDKFSLALKVGFNRFNLNRDILLCQIKWDWNDVVVADNYVCTTISYTDGLRHNPNITETNLNFIRVSKFQYLLPSIGQVDGKWGVDVSVAVLDKLAWEDVTGFRESYVSYVHRDTIETYKQYHNEDRNLEFTQLMKMQWRLQVPHQQKAPERAVINDQGELINPPRDIRSLTRNRVNFNDF